LAELKEKRPKPNSVKVQMAEDRNIIALETSQIREAKKILIKRKKLKKRNLQILK
jgi:hypothetical protein